MIILPCRAAQYFSGVATPTYRQCAPSCQSCSSIVKMAKRMVTSKFDWVALAERVSPTQKPDFHIFKAKADAVLRRMIANPQQPPKIDWAAYKNKIPVAGMVDSFQKQYDSMKVDFPADTYTSQIEAQQKELKVKVAAFIEDCNAIIKSSEEELAKINALMPIEEMTMEDFKDLYPDCAWDRNNPTYFPHTPEYQEPDPEPSKEH